MTPPPAPPSVSTPPSLFSLGESPFTPTRTPYLHIPRGWRNSSPVSVTLGLGADTPLAAFSGCQAPALWESHLFQPSTLGSVAWTFCSLIPPGCPCLLSVSSFLLSWGVTQLGCLLCAHQRHWDHMLPSPNSLVLPGSCCLSNHPLNTTEASSQLPHLASCPPSPYIDGLAIYCSPRPHTSVSVPRTAPRLSFL